MNNGQTGKTTEQLKTAPLNAFYVWPNSNLAYPRALLRKLGRNDITLISTYRLLESMRGINRPVVLDHASFVSFEELAYIKAHNSKVGYVY